MFAAILAGVLVRALGLLPRGIAFSSARTAVAALVGLLAYPVGFFAIEGSVLLLFAAAFSGPGTENTPGPSMLERVRGDLLLGGIVFAGGFLALLMIAVAFAVAVRYWPRRAFRWIGLLVFASISGSIVAGLLHFKISLPALSNSLVFRNFFSDPVQIFIGFGWGVPLVVLVGEPLLGALVGHWLYIAALEWSAESA